MMAAASQRRQQQQAPQRCARFERRRRQRAAAATVTVVAAADSQGASTVASWQARRHPGRVPPLQQQQEQVQHKDAIAGPPSSPPQQHDSRQQHRYARNGSDNSGSGNGSADRHAARRLTRLIGEAAGWRDVAAVCRRHADGMDLIHTAAALVRLAALHGGEGSGDSRSRPQVAPRHEFDGSGGADAAEALEAAGGPRALALALLAMADARAAELTPRLAANMLWAAARVGAAPPRESLAVLLGRCRREGWLNSCRSGDDGGGGSSSGAGFSPQELSNLIYALALLRPYYCGGDGGGDEGGVSSGHLWRAPAISLAHHQRRKPRRPPWDGEFVGALFAASAALLPRANGRDVAMMAYGLCLLTAPAAGEDADAGAGAEAGAPVLPPRGWLAAWAARARAALPQMSAQSLANAAYAAARLAGAGGAGDDFDSSRRGGGGGDWRGAEGSVTDTDTDADDADVAAARAWVGRALQYAAIHAPALSARELVGQLLWAAARLSVGAAADAPAPDGALRALVARATALLAADSPHCGGGSSSGADAEAAADHTAMLVHAMGRLALPPPPAAWQAGLWRAVEARLEAAPARAFGGARLCDLLSGAAALRMPIPARLRAPLLERAAAAAEAGDARLCARVAYCVAAARARPGARWLARYQAASRPLLARFGPQDLANSIWALARISSGGGGGDTDGSDSGGDDAAALAAAVDPRWLDWWLVESLGRLPAFKERELANALWALAALRRAPGDAWLARLLECAAPRLRRFRPRELVAAAWALARLQRRPPDAWLSSFLNATRPRLPDFSAVELAALARALCALRAAPEPRFTEALAAALEARFGGLDAAGAEAALAALHELRAASASAASATTSSSELASTAADPAMADLATLAASVDGALEAGAGAANAAAAMARARPQVPPAARLAPLSAPFLEAFVAEAHGLSALTSLMPDWLRARLSGWPRAWAARRLSLGGAAASVASGSGGLVSISSGGVDDDELVLLPHGLHFEARPQAAAAEARR